MFVKRALSIVITVGIIFSITTKVMADGEPQRIWGKDRCDTAIEVSKSGWNDGSEYAILANGENFPDALSAAPLAKKYNAPILLNPGKGLDNRVKTELKRLNVKQVFIIGGKGVISKNAEDTLNGADIKTTRLYGQDRYETSVKIAEQLGNNVKEIAVASGENFPDAMSIAPIAAQKSMPIILTSGGKLPDSAANYIKDKNITNSYVVGGNDVVSDETLSKLPKAERLYGDSRYDTNTAVAKRFASDLNFNTIYLSSGENFPDALAGSALAAKNSTCVLLISDYIGEATKKFAFDKLPSENNIKILGGQGAVSDKLVNKVIYPNVNEIIGLPKDVLSVRQGEWVYYSSDKYKSTKLSKCKVDGNSIQQLSDKWASQITVVGDWIYFMASEDDVTYETNLYKIKNDGTGEKKLNDENCKWFKVIDNKIYCYSDSGFTTIDSDGNNKANIPVKGAVISCDVVDHYFYYILNNDGVKIYKMKDDGTDIVQISSDEPEFAVDLKVYKNHIYYTTSTDDHNTFHLNKMNMDGTLKTKIADTTYNAFDIFNDWIYYITKDSNFLRRVKIDGSGDTEITQFEGRYLKISNGWIYYLVHAHEYLYPYKIRIDGTDNQKLSN
ncbi:cell wall-binding repeat-containing protein [Clostridium carboxidivorans]|uniref:cell wall-binding repeat-containing protein n=1 Tax=Clostridium carboxidivorans TaxID=217159 RepID=UPI0001D39298|nr:cell wall-binding repeat-containing protein [Clostridium carboxidivorans]EFG86647.1 hypothetical protein CLCAR_3597 [Clostridium carboxidivorans P7]